LTCSQSGNYQQEYLAKFGYKLNVKVKFLKTSFYIFGYFLPEIGIFFLSFGRIMAIVKVKKHMILSLLIFNIAFWLCIANPLKKKGLGGGGQAAGGASGSQ